MKRKKRQNIVSVAGLSPEVWTQGNPIKTYKF
jgi:hypothetical protein